MNSNNLLRFHLNSLTSLIWKWRDLTRMNYSNLAISGQSILGYKFSQSLITLHLLPCPTLLPFPIQEHYYRGSQFTFEGFMTKITIINVKYSSTVSINYENYQVSRQNYARTQGSSAWKGWAVGEFKIYFTRIYSPMNGKPNISIFYRRIIILKALCRA